MSVFLGSSNKISNLFLLFSEDMNMDGRRTKTRTISQTPESIGSESGEFSPQALAMRESMSSEWTDEKHSLYLKSMEASFVNQLYNSMDLLGLQLPEDNPNLSQAAHYDASTPSGQFKVLRGGHWKKIDFPRPNKQSIENESHDMLTSPWIQRFRSGRKLQVGVPKSDPSRCQATSLSEKKTALSGRATCSKHSYLCHCHSCRHGMVDSNTEVSDQNFVDEDIKTENITSKCSSKRLKTRKTGASSNDQVVP